MDTTRPPSSLQVILLVLMAVLLFVPLAAVLTALLANGDLAGGPIGALGEMPIWMAIWMVSLSLFLAVVLAWSVWVLAGWAAAAIVTTRRR